jgi:hypothetical protein
MKNSVSLPVPAFAKMPGNPDKKMADLRKEIASFREAVQKMPYREAVEYSWDEFVGTGLADFTWAPYEIVFDLPDKADKKKAETAASIVPPLQKACRMSMSM